MGISEVWYGVITSKDSRTEPRLRVSSHPFFRGIDPVLIEEVNQGSADTTYETEDLIVREGEVADRFHLIFHGKVAIEVSGPDRVRRTVQTVGPGEVLCWSWISPPYICQFDGRALKETRVVSLDGVGPAPGSRIAAGRRVPVPATARTGDWAAPGEHSGPAARASAHLDGRRGGPRAWDKTP